MRSLPGEFLGHTISGDMDSCLSKGLGATGLSRSQITGIDGSLLVCERSSVVGVPLDAMGGSSMHLNKVEGLAGVFGCSSAAAVDIFPSNTRHRTTSGVAGGWTVVIFLGGLADSVCKQNVHCLRGWYELGIVRANIRGPYTALTSQYRESNLIYTVQIQNQYCFAVVDEFMEMTK